MGVKEVEVERVEAHSTTRRTRDYAQKIAWRCGDLRTGSIAIGLTTLVSSILLSIYCIETRLKDYPFSIEIIVLLLVAMFLIVADCALIYGATKRYSWLLMPWLILHLLLELFLILYLSFKFSELQGSRGVMAVSVLVLLYFAAVVMLFYKKLKDGEKQDRLLGAVVKDPTATGSDPRCLIDLETMALNRTEEAGSKTSKESNALNPDITSKIHFVANDTFTEIAVRPAESSATTTSKGKFYVSLADNPQSPMLDDSGEFTLPTSATESNSKPFSFPLSESFLLNASEQPLPAPDEVIDLHKNGKDDLNRLSTNPFLDNKISSDEMATGSDVNISAEEKHLGGAFASARSELHISRPKMSKKEMVTVDMNLVDAFTPYKQKSRNGCGETSTDDILNKTEELPRMKIFLPMLDEDASDESSSNSSIEPL